jgi:hypothetical protein
MDKVPIPEQTAETLCLEIQEEYQMKPYSLQGWRCWNCMILNLGHLNRMNFNDTPGHRGCPLLNERFQQLRGE